MIPWALMRSLHFVCVWYCGCRCAYAGRRGDRHGGGPVSQSESPTHRHLQRQLGPRGWWQNCWWTCQTGQGSLPAWSDRGECPIVWQSYLLPACCFLSAVSNWTVQAWEDTSGKNKTVFDLDIYEWEVMSSKNHQGGKSEKMTTVEAALDVISFLFSFKSLVSVEGWNFLVVWLPGLFIITHVFLKRPS